MAFSLQSEANALYSDVSSGGSDLSDTRRKLGRAQELLNEAITLGSTSVERASCCHDLGALNFLWSRVELETAPSWTAVPADTLAACTSHLELSVRFYLSAKVEGARAAKPEEWFANVEERLRSLVDWAKEQTQLLAIGDGAILRPVSDAFDGAITKWKVESVAAVVADLALAETLLNYRSDKSVAEALANIGKIRELLNRAEVRLRDENSRNEELQEKIGELWGKYNARYTCAFTKVASPPRTSCCGLC